MDVDSCVEEGCVRVDSKHVEDLSQHLTCTWYIKDLRWVVTANSRVYRLLTFYTRGRFFNSMHIWEFLRMAPWAWFMYMLDAETSPQQVWYWHDPSLTRWANVHGISLRTSAFSRAILTAPKTVDACACHGSRSRLISTFQIQSGIASRQHSVRLS